MQPVGERVLLFVAGRLRRTVAGAVAGLAIGACLAAPAAYSIATAATRHSGAIPSVGPSRHGGGAGPGGLLDSPKPVPTVSAALANDAAQYTWAAAVIGSNNAAGYQLASGAPVMAIGGFNGTDPAPTLEEFQDYVASGQILYFIRGRMMTGHWGSPTSGSREAADIAEWVETHYPPLIIDRVVVYDLSHAPRNS